MAFDRNPDMKTLVLAGGVAANSHLRTAVAETAEKFGAKLFLPPLKLCGDNAAMVAAQGVHEFIAGNFSDTYLNASACD
jgi:N6-L-threonylcarbamoyladenine synthase